MLKIIRRVVLVLVIGVVTGIVGLLAGILFGGNFATDFTFNGVRGYEATGQIGLIVGALVDLITGWRFLLKKKKDVAHP